MCKWKSFKNWMEKYIIWIILILTLAAAIAINHFPYLYDFIYTCKKSSAAEEINAWFYFLSGAGTLALACIAYFKFSGFYDQNEAKFLLDIDDRWSKSEILRARTIVHELYVKVEEEDKETLDKLSHTCRNNFIEQEVGKKILEIRHGPHQAVKEYEALREKLCPDCKKDLIEEKFDKEDTTKRFYKEEDFIHLLNLLDFMETIGYLHDEGYVKSDSLNTLCGADLVFNYKIFKAYIADKRIKRNNMNYYKNFQKLCEELDPTLKPTEKNN